MKKKEKGRIKLNSLCTRPNIPLYNGQSKNKVHQLSKAITSSAKIYLNMMALVC